MYLVYLPEHLYFQSCNLFISAKWTARTSTLTSRITQLIFKYIPPCLLIGQRRSSRSTLMGYPLGLDSLHSQLLSACLLLPHVHASELRLAFSAAFPWYKLNAALQGFTGWNHNKIIILIALLFAYCSALNTCLHSQESPLWMPTLIACSSIFRVLRHNSQLSAL